MKRINFAKNMMRLWKDRRGQDLLEYALMGGFVALSAGALILPQVSSSISKIFVHVSSVMTVASSEGNRRPTPTSNNH
jgi:Flp pilus assembly pilin Flp